MRKNLLFITFIFVQTVSFSQTISIKGNIYNEATNTTIPFVNIGIKGTYSGTTTNSHGEFSLNLPSNLKYRTLVFSCIGFENKEYQVKPEETDIRISLTPHTYDINEVTIMPDSTLRSFLRKAYDKIPKNYPDVPTKYEGFYRSSIQNNKGEYLRFMEVLTESYKSSYKNSEDGTVKVLKSRKFISPNAIQDFPIYYYGIIHQVHSKDYVKKRSSFLKGDFKFNYKLVGKTTYNGKMIYEIEFEPANPSSDRSRGTFYIDSETLAYIKIEKYSTPTQLKKRSKLPPMKLNGMKCTSRKSIINYTHYNGKYYLNSFYDDESIKNKKENTILSAVEYITTSFKYNDIEKIPYIEQAPITYTPAMEATNYSETNWHDYNILPLNTSLQLDSIQAKQLLSTQVKEKKDWRTLFVNIVNRFEADLGFEASQMQRASGDYSLSYQDLNFHQNVSHAGYQYGLYANVDYKPTPKNLLSYKYKRNLLKKDFIKFDAIRYKRLFPIKTMGKQIIANLNAGWVWQKSGYSLGTTHSESNFKFGGKKFKNDKVEAFSGLKINGASLGGGLDIQISHLFYLSTSANYIIPAKTEHILILKERSGFFLFRKTAWENIDNQDIDFSIDGINQTHSGMSFNNWAVSVGIKLKF